MTTIFDELCASLKEAGEVRAGKRKPSRKFEYPPADIKKLRGKLHVSQEEFALLIGVSCGTLRNWEQGRRKPEGPAQALLRVVEKHPDAVLDALMTGNSK